MTIKSVSAFTHTAFTFEADPAFNFKMNSKSQSSGKSGKTQHNHNVNNMATRNIHGG